VTDDEVPASGDENGPETDEDAVTPDDAAAAASEGDAEESTVALDEFHDALEDAGRPVVTASEVGRTLDRDQSEAVGALEELVDRGDVRRVDVDADPVVWYPTEWGEIADRERVVPFPKRREIVVDQPSQFTRAQLSQFAHLADVSGTEAYRYEIRKEDVWQAPYDSFDRLLKTVRQVLPERLDGLEEWIEDQWERARQFRLFTHEDGYTVLEARSAELMGNVARQKLDEDQLRAPISDTESWVAEGSEATIKRTLYEAGYPVQDQRDLDEGDPLDVSLDLDLRGYQSDWVTRFVDSGSGVLVGPPGSGKTVAAMGIMAAIGGETLILVPTRELASQWRDTLLAHTDIAPEDIGEYHGGEKNVRPVTIATYQTAGMDRHRQLFDERRWGLITYDECLGEDTIIETDDGRTTFSQLNDTYGLTEGWNFGPDFSVRTFDPEQSEYVWDEVTGVFKARRTLHRITTTTGKAIEATPNHTHVIFDPNSFELTEQEGVSEGDYLVQPTPSVDIETDQSSLTVPEATAELLGWALGDGHLNRYGDAKFSFATLLDEQVGTITRLCERLNLDYSVFDNDRGDVTIWVPDLQQSLNWDGDTGDKTRTVSVPRECYNWSNERIAALLRGLFDAEGSVSEKGRIQFNSVSEQLADDVHLLLQRLGILSRRFSIERKQDEHSTVHRVNVPSFYGAQFENAVGFRLEHKLERLCDGGTPATGIPAKAVLQEIGDKLNLSSTDLASMMDLTGSTVYDVRNGEHRLGQHHLQTLAASLMEYANRDTKDLNAARERYNITYKEVGSELECTSGGAYSRLQREESRAIETLEELVRDRQRVATEYARKLQILSDVDLLEVADVEAIGEQPVYDFETKTHTFLADGFLTHNCHHIPSDVFRRSADLQTSARLGLSATPIREDDREKEIYTLIGPPIGTDWDALFDAGYVQEPEVEIRYVPWDQDTYQDEYATAERHEKRQLAASNPAKVEEVREILADHPGSKALIFADYIDQGDELAEALTVPFVSGEMPHARRERLFSQFRRNDRDVLLVSRVGDEGIDLPDADLAIMASGLGGSRRQGSQRAGRTMRPSGKARVFVLATRGTTEEEFARRQLQHLQSKGVRVKEVDSELDDGV